MTPSPTPSPLPLVVYTAITGGFPDTLRLPPLSAAPPPPPANRPVRYIAFTDNHFPATGRWEVCRPAWEHLDSPRRTARWHKVNPHLCLPPHEISLWLDGSHQLLDDPRFLADRYLTEADVSAFVHGSRDCVYDELAACLQLRKDDPAVMNNQMARYRAEGYPKHNGLLETSVMLRRNTPAVRAFNADWWREIEAGSLRDQLSVNYVLWKRGMTAGRIEGCRERSPHFRFWPHR